MLVEQTNLPDTVRNMMTQAMSNNISKNACTNAFDKVSYILDHSMSTISSS